MKKYILISILILLAFAGFSQTRRLIGLDPTGRPGFLYYDTLRSQYYAHPLIAVNDSTAGMDTARYYITSFAKNAGRDSTIITFAGGVQLAVKDSIGNIDSAIWKNNATYTAGNKVLTMGGVSQQFTGGRVLFDSIRVGATFRVTANTQGMKIGFNDSVVTNSTGANIDITNSGGADLKQTYDNMTGSGNIKIIASSANKTKASMAGTISGINNTLINGHLSATLSGNDNIGIGNYDWLGTSGSNSILLGYSAGKGLTTGGTNIQLVTRNTSASSAPNVNDFMLFGDKAGSLYDTYVAGDIAFAPWLDGSPANLWIGGRAMEVPVTLSLSVAAFAAVTNSTGYDFNINGSRATGAGEAGTTILRFTTPIASGATLQSTYTQSFKSERLGNTIGKATTLTRAPDAILDIQANTTDNVPVMIPPRTTTTQRDLIQKGLLSITVTANGSGYTNGNIALSFSGGGGSGAAGYVLISGGAVQPATVVITARGTGYTSSPTISVTSGGGTGATFSSVIGATEAGLIYNTTTHKMNMWDSTRWVEEAKILSASATLDFPSTLAGTSSDLTVTCTGAADGDVVSVGVPNGSTLANGVFSCWVSAADTVTVRFSNNSLTLALDPASGSFKVKVFKD